VLQFQRDNVDAHRVVLIVQGHIVDPWAEVLERECLDLIGSGKHVVIDLSGVGFVGRSGIQVLVCLIWAGAGLAGCPALIADMLAQEGIRVSRNVGDTQEGRASRKKR